MHVDDGSPAERHNERGNSAFAAGDYASACSSYSRAIDLAAASDPRRAVYYTNRSTARLRLEEPAAARHDALLALTLSPAGWKPRLRLASALDALGRSDAAADEARCLLEAPALPAAAAMAASDLLRRSTEASAAARVAMRSE